MSTPLPSYININDDKFGARMLQDQSTASACSTNVVWASGTVFHCAKNLQWFWFCHKTCEGSIRDLSCLEQLSICRFLT